MYRESYDLDQYEQYLLAAKKYNAEYMKTLFIAAIVAFIASVALFYFNMTVAGVISLAISIFFYQGSSHYHLLNDVLDTQWYLALLIYGHTKELALLRTEIGHGQDARTPFGNSA